MTARTEFDEFDEPHRFGVPTPVIERRLVVVRGMTPCEDCQRTGSVIPGYVCGTCEGDGWLPASRVTP